MQKITLSITTLLMLAFLMVGCGKKGPLYLPDDADKQTNQTSGLIDKQ